MSTNTGQFVVFIKSCSTWFSYNNDELKSVWVTVSMDTGQFVVLIKS